MKCRIVTTLLWVSIILSLLTPVVFATSNTEVLSDEEQTTLFKNMNFQLLHNEDLRGSIHCFAVNENEDIAIAIDNSLNSRVYVYDSTGTFQYGYSFDTLGAFYVGFNKDVLYIYLVRGEIFIELDHTGKYFNAYREIAFHENPQEKYSYELYEATTRKTGNAEYTLERDVAFGNKYSRLIVTDASGKRTILYDVTIQHNIASVTKYFLMAGFFTIVVIVAYKKIKSTEDSSKQD